MAMNRILVLLSAFAAALCANAGFEQIDGKDYWRDDGGTLHQYLYLQGHSSKLTSPKYLAQPSDTTTTPWVAGSVLVTSSNITYSGSWAYSSPSSLCGFCLQANNPDSGYYTFDITTTFPLGAYGIRAERAGVNFRSYTSSFNITESQTWSGLPAESLSASPFTIAIPNYYSNTTWAKGKIICTSENAKLRLAGDMRLLLAATNCSMSTCDVIVEKPAYLAVRQYNFGSGDKFFGHLGAHSLTLDGGAGLIFGSATTGTNTIPILSPDRIAPTVVLTNGALLSASADTTITGGVTIVSAAGTEGSVTGTYILDDDATAFRAEADSTLDLSAMNMVVHGTFALSGSGKIKMANVRLDGAQMQNFSGTIEIPSGTLYIPRAADVPASVKFETTGSGALYFGDAAGFDAATRLSGTSNLLDGSSGLVITDVKRESVSVGAGETLLVCGNGLDADGTLSLAAGATVMFCKTATIAAPISQSGAVTFETFSPAVTGTVSGVYTASAGAMTVISPGLLRFTGGGTVYGLIMNSGNAEITGERITCNGNLSFLGGYLTIKDGGKVYLGKVNWIKLALDQAQTSDATLEVGPGGYFQHINGYNQHMLIGKSKNFISRLYINGGEVRMVVHEPFNIDGNGIVEIDNGGVLRTVRPIGVGSGGLGNRCGIIFGNGTFCATQYLGEGVEESPIYNYRGFIKYANIISSGAVPVTVKGDFLFDLTYFVNNPITNQSDTVTSVWKFEDGGRIRVKGNKKKFIIRRSSMPHAAIDLTTELPAATVEFLAEDNGEGAPAPQSIEWTVPTNGVTAGTVVTDGLEGQAVPLVASYRVPANAEFSDAAMAGWATGFADGGVSNLTFESGSAWRFAAFPFSPLALAGALSLPAELPCTVVAGGPAGTGAAVAPVATAAEGVSGADCVFPCRGVGVNLRNSSIAVDGASVVLSYASPGFMVILK